MLVKEFLEICDSFCGDESFVIFDSDSSYSSIFERPKAILNFDDCLRDYGNCQLKRFYIDHEHHDNIQFLVEVPS